MPPREVVHLDLDQEVAEMLRTHAAAAGVSEAEIVERAMRALDLRMLVQRIRSRSDLDEGAALRLVSGELEVVRAERRG